MPPGGINGKKVEVIPARRRVQARQGHRQRQPAHSPEQGARGPRLDLQFGVDADGRRDGEGGGAAARNFVDQLPASRAKRAAPGFSAPAISERSSWRCHAKYMSENAGKKVAYLYTTDGAGLAFADMEYMRNAYEEELITTNPDAQVRRISISARISSKSNRSTRRCSRSAASIDALRRIMQQARSRHLLEDPRVARPQRASNAPCRSFRQGDAAKGLSVRGGLQLQRRAPRRVSFVKLTRESTEFAALDHDVQPSLRVRHRLDEASASSRAKPESD